jgi:hypothetical protein
MALAWAKVGSWKIVTRHVLRPLVFKFPVIKKLFSLSFTVIPIMEEIASPNKGEPQQNH